MDESGKFRLVKGRSTEAKVVSQGRSEGSGGDSLQLFDSILSASIPLPHPSLDGGRKSATGLQKSATFF